MISPGGSLLDIGVSFPEEWMPASEISKAVGIPEEVIVGRLGPDGKYASGREDPSVEGLTTSRP